MVCIFIAKLTAYPLEVFQRAKYSRDPFVVLGASLEFIGQLIEQVIFSI
jgi:hypothetical protein